MKAKLAGIRQDPLDAKHKHIDIVRQLEDDECRKYSEAASHLRAFSAYTDLWIAVHWNYGDYVDLLQDYYEQFVTNSHFTEECIRRMMLNINRCLLNYLTLVRTFLEHSETRLTREFGKESSRYRTFKNACSYA